MNESISRLMDGDADDEAVARVCRACGEGGTMATWVSYHVIGDVLRNGGTPAPGFSRRFSQSFAGEPTVLAPASSAAARAARGERDERLGHRLGVVWAMAATAAAVGVVGWTAVSLTEAPDTAIARARESVAVNAAQLRPQSVPADYLLAHQEYSPATAMQGVGPYLRAVSAPVADGQR